MSVLHHSWILQEVGESRSQRRAGNSFLSLFPQSTILLGLSAVRLWISRDEISIFQFVTHAAALPARNAVLRGACRRREEASSKTVTVKLTFSNSYTAGLNFITALQLVIKCADAQLRMTSTAASALMLEPHAVSSQHKSTLSQIRVKDRGALQSKRFSISCSTSPPLSHPLKKKWVKLIFLHQVPLTVFRHVHQVKTSNTSKWTPVCM